jgi:hypothetical protein
MVSRERGIEPRAAECSKLRVSDVSHYTIPDCLLLEIGGGFWVLGLDAELWGKYGKEWCRVRHVRGRGRAGLGGGAMVRCD